MAETSTARRRAVGAVGNSVGTCQATWGWRALVLGLGETENHDLRGTQPYFDTFLGVDFLFILFNHRSFQ